MSTEAHIRQVAQCFFPFISYKPVSLGSSKVASPFLYICPMLSLLSCLYVSNVTKESSALHISKKCVTKKQFITNYF